MKKVYLYPLTARSGDAVVNPYIFNLRDALNTHFNVVNADKPSTTGIFDILKYLRKIEIVYFNWGEEVPGFKYGILQGIFLLLLIQYLKLSSIQIVWTLHNKKSHHSHNALLKRMLYNQMLKKSNLIITHASDGLKIIPDGKLASFQHHPVTKSIVKAGKDKKYSYDIIIWGTIYPYKGIHTFLNYLKGNGLLEKYRILIAGKIVTEALADELQVFHKNYDNLELMEGFIEQDKLVELVQASKITLFTYHSDSILSSGVLMDSLTYGANIVGPAVGAFNDLKELELIDTYSDYKSLLDVVDQVLLVQGEDTSRQIKLDEFMKANSWENFSATILKLIEKNGRKEGNESNN